MASASAAASVGGRTIDTSTPAVVLAVHDHNGLGQVRTLGRLGVEVWITHPPGRLPATRSRYAAGRRFPWDMNGVSADRTVEHLLEVVGPAIGRRAVLLPSDDESAVLIAEHAEVLSPWFIAPTPPPDLPRRLVDKHGLFELCAAAGVPCPATSAPRSDAEVEAFLRDATFPVVAKARVGYRLRGLSDHATYICHSADEAREAVAALSAGDEPNAVLHEYLPGGPDAVWVYHAYVDREGRPCPSRVGNRLREYPVDTGLTTFGINRPNEAVRAAGDALVQQIGYRGIVDLDFRLDPRDGRYKPLDFNPRPGANFRLFTDDSDIDVVRAAYLDLTDQRVHPGQPHTGRKWMVEHWDLVGARKYIRSGRMSARAYTRSLRGVQETAWWAADDPVPFGAMLVEVGETALRYASRS